MGRNGVMVGRACSVTGGGRPITGMATARGWYPTGDGASVVGCLVEIVFVRPRAQRTHASTYRCVYARNDRRSGEGEINGIFRQTLREYFIVTSCSPSTAYDSDVTSNAFVSRNFCGT